ncbi:Glutathione peroxidase 2 [Monosporozyma unispora]|nr:Glutathione peroxidase 2 [Kazachstania unispora]
MSQFYDLKAQLGNGKIYDFDQLRGKVVLIVNVASRCGFTPQYKELQYFYEKYGEMGLEILGFPCNQFGNQEPLTDEQISDFTREKFGVTFPILKKIDVNGPDEHPVYHYLKEQKHGVLGFKGIKWNFEKFLIDRNGIVTNRYFSAIPPITFESRIVELLEQPN